MKKLIFTILLLTFVFLTTKANEHWDIFYKNYLINPGINVQSKFATGTDGKLYLAEIDYSGIYDPGITYVDVRSYEISQWTQDNIGQEGWINLGQRLQLKMPNNESNIDFVVTEDNQLYVGMQDSIFWYDANADYWVSYFVEDYIGGMMADETGRILILQSIEDDGEHHFQIAEFDSGNLVPVATIDYTLPGNIQFFHRIMNEANRILKYEDNYYVSIARASSHQNYYFVGNETSGFTMLQEHFTHLNLSSMVISPEGELIISHRLGASPYSLALKQYNFELNQWEDFNMQGLNDAQVYGNQLAFDQSGQLYLSYSADFNLGFLYEFNGSGWDHVGPLESVAVAHMPRIAFDSENQLFLMHGIGSGSAPLTIRRLTDPTADLNEREILNQKIHLYPNPVSQSFIIDLYQISFESGEIDLEIYNSNGQLILKQAATDAQTMINVNDLPDGIYVVNVRSATNNYSQRFVKQ
ncbi:MAG: T9SS type A sorting domain-containing protein [Bacteroidales bacterium]|jgi:hypothetical protein|nr:T9SS type A sorting domain-containing protein [Bacteroidales bacterium]HOI32849.1 T9SS type A sorting domain-containing protein [Bacteroidales bacterium]